MGDAARDRGRDVPVHDPGRDRVRPLSRACPVVFVVDDDPSVREGIRRLLESRDIQAETFATAEQFLAASRPETVACLVLDVRLPGLTGLDLQQTLLDAGTTIPTVFITGHGEVPLSVQAMKGGAVDFLTKPFRNEQLLEAIGRALDRGRVERSQAAVRAETGRRLASLTSGERDVMNLLVAGLLNKQIAARLGVAEITVKVRRARVMKKMRVDSLVELTRRLERLRSA
jgi:FixJ family two-component response regulator